ncbi:MAG: hypothetical protein WBG23_09270 [Acidobacteriaceae bacterium]
MLDPFRTNLNKNYPICQNPGSDHRHTIDGPGTFFAPQSVAGFDTLRAMTGKSIQPAQVSGNMAG